MTGVRTFFAPAKLNLMLQVVGRRPDGYHLLQTVFRFIDYGDTLTIGVRQDGRIVRTTELAGVEPESDLTVRAARLLQEATGTRLGAEIGVVKRLPMGGGLGGGSSDAATVLIALNHLWGTGCTRADLQKLGLGLGADVPVFVFGQSAFAEGVGEELQPLTLPAAWYLVLTPPAHVATARVFGHPALKRDAKMITIQGFSAGAAAGGGLGENSLEPVVCGEYPIVAEHLAWLRQQAPAMMTGSGACVFAAFATEGEARAVAAKLPAGMTGFVARGLDRHPLYELLS